MDENNKFLIAIDLSYDAAISALTIYVYASPKLRQSFLNTQQTCGNPTNFGQIAASLLLFIPNRIFN